MRNVQESYKQHKGERDIVRLFGARPETMGVFNICRRCVGGDVGESGVARVSIAKCGTASRDNERDDEFTLFA